MGLAVPAAHAVYLLAGIPLPYESHPDGWAGPASLLILLVPAGLGAVTGAFLRRTKRRTGAHDHR